MAYVVDRSPQMTLVPAIGVAISRYEQIRALEKLTPSATSSGRKLVDRASRCSSPDLTERSIPLVQKTSMDRRLSMREVSDAPSSSSSPKIRDIHEYTSGIGMNVRWQGPVARMRLRLNEASASPFLTRLTPHPL